VLSDLICKRWLFCCSGEAGEPYAREGLKLKFYVVVFGLTCWLQLELTPLILSPSLSSPQIQEEVANLQAIKLKLQSNDAEGAGGKFVLKCPKVKIVKSWFTCLY